MLTLVWLFFSFLRNSLCSRAALQAEILALRHQLLVLQRSTRCRKVRLLGTVDRNLLGLAVALLARLAASFTDPQSGDRHRLGPQGLPVVLELEEPHREGTTIDIAGDSRLNPQDELGQPTLGCTTCPWGTPETTVAKYMVRPRRPSSQTWKTFLKNHVHELVSTDFFVVPTATFRLLFVFLVLSHDRRRIVHFGVTSHPTSEWTAQQLRHAFPWDTAPRFLLRDRDCCYGEPFPETLQAMNVEQILTAPRSPWQNAYVERLIGSIRRECLDHVIIFHERGLRRILQSYFDYYENSRTHLGLAKDAPVPRAVQLPELGKVIALPQVGGLHHRYERRAA